MNPLHWKREHRVALGVAAANGAALAVIAAFAIGYSEANKVTTPFTWWMEHRALDWWGWILFGALIGAGWIYAGRLLRN